MSRAESPDLGINSAQIELDAQNPTPLFIIEPDETLCFRGVVV